MKIFLLCIIIIAGCENNNTKYINSYKVLKPSDNTENPANEENWIPFLWNVPDNWVTNNKSPMRAASYSVPHSTGNGDLSVTYFPGDAGGIIANVNRWRKQLGLIEMTEKEIKANSEKFKSVIGLYQLYKIINPDKKDSAFLCSIIPAVNFTIFIKLTTHPESINGLMEEFIEFSSSFRYNE